MVGKYNFVEFPKDKGSLKIKNGLTKRAPDVWESAAFSGIFLASSFFCSQAESTLRPHAGNANRWAAGSNAKSTRKAVKPCSSCCALHAPLM
jgi:hypothetical protein